MPTYEYECPHCHTRYERQRAIAARDKGGFCAHGLSDRHMEAFELVRVQSSPSFTVKGFNARNGYSTAD